MWIKKKEVEKEEEFSEIKVRVFMYGDVPQNFYFIDYTHGARSKIFLSLSLSLSLARSLSLSFSLHSFREFSKGIIIPISRSIVLDPIFVHDHCERQNTSLHKKRKKIVNLLFFYYDH